MYIDPPCKAVSQLRPIFGDCTAKSNGRCMARINLARCSLKKLLTPLQGFYS
ncbi:hypothetical protein YSA_02109 [Pseudomonas putida ND6]|uniref:Uncharacterized protein n=1 Tax=Pseudomonas putida ND6 TaxID=231023 RepID=I3UQZ5_PSEPU|nr:hypothetical protein YSA_02109 [Pseudomonas putida ND6]